MDGSTMARTQLRQIGEHGAEFAHGLALTFAEHHRYACIRLVRDERILARSKR